MNNNVTYSNYFFYFCLDSDNYKISGSVYDKNELLRYGLDCLYNLENIQHNYPSSYDRVVFFNLEFFYTPRSSCEMTVYVFGEVRLSLTPKKITLEDAIHNLNITCFILPDDFQPDYHFIKDHGDYQSQKSELIAKSGLKLLYQHLTWQGKEEFEKLLMRPPF